MTRLAPAMTSKTGTGAIVDKYVETVDEGAETGKR